MASQLLHINQRSFPKTSSRLTANLAKGISNNVLPAISQMFKDTLLFSGPEMEMMGLFLTDHVKTATIAVQVAVSVARDQFRSKHTTGNKGNAFNHMQPCI